MKRPPSDGVAAGLPGRGRTIVPAPPVRSEGVPDLEAWLSGLDPAALAASIWRSRR